MTTATCNKHGEFKEAIDTLKKQTEKQWDTIEAIKERGNKIYGGVIVLLLGTIINISLTLFK